MTQGHHPDYDALLHHGTSLVPHTPHHGAPPAHGAAPHAMVPMHEVQHMIRNELAAHQSRTQMPQHGPIPQHAAPPVHHHHDEGYEPERGRGRRESRDRREVEHRRRRESEFDGMKVRKFPIGFVWPQIAGGAVQDIEVKPQVCFQGHRLAVAASTARYFNIVDIKVGKDSQLAATGEMPAETFSSLAVGTQMELDRAQPGIVIVLSVRNTDTNAQDFGAVLYGEVEEE